MAKTSNKATIVEQNGFKFAIVNGKLVPDVMGNIKHQVKKVSATTKRLAEDAMNALQGKENSLVSKLTKGNKSSKVADEATVSL